MSNPLDLEKPDDLEEQDRLWLEFRRSCWICGALQPKDMNDQQYICAECRSDQEPFSDEF